MKNPNQEHKSKLKAEVDTIEKTEKTHVIHSLFIRIKRLQSHVASHRKDYTCIRSLKMLVSQLKKRIKIYNS